MRELTLALGREKKAGYLKIADSVRNAILDGQLKSGESLPSTRALGRTLKMHRHTVMSGLNELIAEGWLVSKERQTYQVNETLPSSFFEASVAGGENAVPKKHEWRMVRSSGEKLPSLMPSSAKYPFKSGTADLRLFPHQEFKSLIGESLKASRVKNLDYAHPAGHPPLIDALKTYLRRARAVSNREIVVTHGSQEGIFLAAQLLIKPGDAVAVERLGYRPAWEALKAAGAKLIPVDVDSEGLDPDSLSKAMRRHRIRLIYTTPLHQYPTTVTLPVARRLRLYELAAQAGIPILEDDYDHEFHYRSQPLAPLASRDPAELVIYVSTFSKTLFPSARIGFMAVPKTLAPALAGYRRIVSRQNETLLQDATARWMNTGGFERHLRRMRRTYEERRTTIVECLEEGKSSGLPLSWQAPDGGMAVWVGIGMDADKAFERALELGVHVQPESYYQLRGGKSEHLRLGFANQTPKEIQLGMQLLFEALKERSR